MTAKYRGRVRFAFPREQAADAAGHAGGRRHPVVVGPMTILENLISSQ